jgi:hypothetical protein
MANLKIVVKTTNAGVPASGGVTITYVQDDRKRVEDRRQFPQSLRPGGPVVVRPGPRIATITRCDLNQIFVLNLDDREYVSMPIPRSQSREERQAQAVQRPKPQPTLLVEITTSDTGERKEMFGFTARHVITTQKQTPLIESGQQPQENVTDGWYIDLDASIPCDTASPSSKIGVLTATTRKPGEPFQVPVLTFKSIGQPESGFALATRQLFRANSSPPNRPAQTTESLTRETQVTELSMMQLDPALFEVPASFRKVLEIRRIPLVPLWQRWLGWLNYYWTRLKSAI